MTPDQALRIQQRNARNAQHSTGPRSAEGKARVARNALKHGFCAADIVMPSDDPAAFDALLRHHQEAWQPEDPDESELVNEIAVATWRRWRLRRAEAELWAVRCAGPATGLLDPEDGASADAERILNLGEAIANDCDSAANAIEKVRRWWQGNERHLTRCEERLRARKNIARHLGVPRTPQTKAPGKTRAYGRFLDALIERPVPGETPEAVTQEFRQFTEQTQSTQIQPDQPVAAPSAAPPGPVSPIFPPDSPTPGGAVVPTTSTPTPSASTSGAVVPTASTAPTSTPPSTMATARNRAERRRLEKAQRKAQRGHGGEGGSRRTQT